MLSSCGRSSFALDFPHPERSNEKQMIDRLQTTDVNKSQIAFRVAIDVINASFHLFPPSTRTQMPVKLFCARAVASIVF